MTNLASGDKRVQFCWDKFSQWTAQPKPTGTGDVRSAQQATWSRQMPNLVSSELSGALDGINRNFCSTTCSLDLQNIFRNKIFAGSSEGFTKIYREKLGQTDKVSCRTVRLGFLLSSGIPRHLSDTRAAVWYPRAAIFSPEIQTLNRMKF